ncbi:SMP-30/gluconolactonase/LRE family protein [Bosea sp. (in: a-proteobacteria)]|uniref:SMP-30/gluconolactonase/LRE family protein n=1 Tax=Bosea sp. (in: a-proteobacteria) TaxID=1871050 RepID=UPI00262740FF|nr:SMP-30/gluconolactonase/LRE family protein [Bosea sp. (in: a-proteobacteria)]MCO5092928.1 SMP-30/gluconolactonase/LRE family protein [Bosea sp. (in: a-proteobacteria)]
MKRVVEIEQFCSLANLAGECPLWNPDDGHLYWIDARGRAIFRQAPGGAPTRWALPKRIGSFGFRADGGILAAMEDGFFRLDLRARDGDGAFTRRLIVEAEPDLPDNRMNDGKCDRRGRYWCGSRGEDSVTPLGSLYRLDGRECTRMDVGFIVPNGIAFSPDDRTMMMSDSESDVLFAYDFDLEEGVISNRRLFCSTADMPCRVDGAAFDSEGGYWCAMIYDGMIVRFDPVGRIDRIVRLPTRYPTMCCFGGPDLETMYVTTGTIFLQPGEAEQQPLAGCVLAIHGLGVRGVGEPRFAG